MDEELQNRLKRVAAKRGGSFLIQSLAQPDDPKAAADDFARSLRYRAIGERWVQVQPSLAAATLARLLHQWLAWPKTFMPASEAQALAEEFVSTFRPAAVCLTNVTWYKEKPGPTPDATPFSWYPITEATYDAGVVCFGESQAGMLWFEEED